MPRTTLRSNDGAASFMDGLPDNAERMLRLARARESQQSAGETLPEDVANVVDPFAFHGSPDDVVDAVVEGDEDEAEALAAAEADGSHARVEDDREAAAQESMADEAVVEDAQAEEDALAEEVRAAPYDADADAHAQALPAAAVRPVNHMSFSAAQAANMLGLGAHAKAKRHRGRKVLRVRVHTRSIPQ